MADESALQGQPSHLANGSRGRSQVLPYQPHGFTDGKLKAGDNATRDSAKPHLLLTHKALASTGLSLAFASERLQCDLHLQLEAMRPANCLMSATTKAVHDM